MGLNDMTEFSFLGELSL